MNLLILYPEIFLSYSKFERKLKKLLSVKSPDTISIYSDPNEFITKFVQKHLPATQYEQAESFNLDSITHAVIFDDGEEFAEKVTELSNRGVNLRRVKIKLTRVVNIKNVTDLRGVASTPTYEYIGRGSYWGNPYSMYENGDDRDEVIRKFKYDFDEDKFPNKEKKEVYKLAGKRLGCFCKPLPCHGDVLANYLNALDDEE